MSICNKVELFIPCQYLTAVDDNLQKKQNPSQMHVTERIMEQNATDFLNPASDAILSIANLYYMCLPMS